jgi:hypothetical protein
VNYDLPSGSLPSLSTVLTSAHPEKTASPATTTPTRDAETPHRAIASLCGLECPGRNVSTPPAGAALLTWFFRWARSAAREDAATLCAVASRWRPARSARALPSGTFS